MHVRLQSTYTNSIYLYEEKMVGGFLHCCISMFIVLLGHFDEERYALSFV